MLKNLAGCILVALGSFSAHAKAAPIGLDLADSFFGAIVFKEGFASGFAHNHLVFAKSLRIVKWDLPEGKPVESGVFEAEADVSQVFVDDFAVSKKWISTLETAGILSPEVELSEIKAGTRDEIQETMRGETQLDQGKFPKITLVLKNLILKSGNIGVLKTTHEAALSITIHGVTREIRVPTRIELNTNELNVVCAGPLKFTDFGIEPISTALGMVRNKNEFQLFVSLKGRK